MATKLQIYNEALRLIGDLQLATITDDTESRYILDDAYDRCVTHVLSLAAWRFATKTVSIASSSSTNVDFIYQFTKPGDWIRSHSIFVLGSDISRQCPVDCRDEGLLLYANATVIKLRYVSSAGADPSLWTEGFAKTFAAYLAFSIANKIEGSEVSSEEMFNLFKAFRDDALPIEAIKEDAWLEAQLNGRFRRAAEFILTKGFWRFAMTTAAMTGISSGPPGYAYGASKPSDWMRTHALFVLAANRECPIDARESASSWSTNIANFTARYLSVTTGLDATKWPEPFTKAVLAYIEFEAASLNQSKDEQIAGETAKTALAQAQEFDSLPEDTWLPHQLSGQFVRSVEYLLEIGEWKFAIKSVSVAASMATPSPDYAYALLKPADWFRTVELYQPLAVRVQRDLDYRDEGGYWHTQFAPVTVRYISTTLGLDSTRWSKGFDSAVLAHAMLAAATADPRTPGAVLEARQNIWKDAERTARDQDDMRERPVVAQVGRFVRGRFGSYGDYAEQGWPWVT